MSQVTATPKELFDEGLTRAKNMGVALAMIIFLLAKYVVVKLIWKRVERVLAIVVVRTAVLLSALYLKAQPHIERFRVMARETKNKTFRLLLGVMILILTPIENGLLKMFGLAKVQSERLAVEGASKAVQVIVPMMQALGQVIKAGFSKPAIQRMLNRLFQVLEEAQK